MLTAKFEYMEKSSLTIRTEMASNIENLVIEKNVIRNQVDIIRKERELIASQLLAFSEKILKVNLEMRQMQADNRRIATHNDNLRAELYKISNEKMVGGSSKKLSVNRQYNALPAKMLPRTIGSIQIAEGNTVIVTGGMKNGITMRTVTAIRVGWEFFDTFLAPGPVKLENMSNLIAKNNLKLFLIFLNLISISNF